MARQIVLGETQTLLKSQENINFPHFFQLKNGRQYLRFSEGYHTVIQRDYNALSDDGGATWELTRQPHPLHEFDDGTLVALGWGTYHSAYSEDLQYYGDPGVRVMATLHSTDAGENWEAAFYHIAFPFALQRLHVDAGTLMLPDGTLLQVCNGLKEGAEHGVSLLIASGDRGHSWEYRGTAGPPPSHQEELGLNETGFAHHHPSGDLVALFRPGAPGALYGARSSDLGHTWSAPEIIWDELFDYITPGMICLADGTLVATYGTRYSNLAGKGPRPGGVWLMHSEDGGHSWEEPLLVYDQPSCNNNRLWHGGGQHFRLFYSRSGFCHLEPRRGNNSICAVDAAVA